MLAAALAAAPAAEAVIGIDQERDVADLLVTEVGGEDDDTAAERRWAILPQVGYGPESGPVGGLKLAHRDLLGLGITADVDGTYSLNQQQALALGVGTPHLFDRRALVLFRVSYEFDPQRDFFGLGNNDLGPDPAATNGEEDARGELTLAWRPFRGRLAVAAGVALRWVDVERGDRDGDTPLTVEAFPELPGIDGGFTNPLGLALVYNGRDDLVQPTRGWRLIAKVAHTNRHLKSDFEFTRTVLDAGYLHPLDARGRHVVGARLSGAYIDGPRRDVPFWELTELGGDDTLRGFFPRRFLGQSHVLLNVEYRPMLFAFDFFDVWRVQVGATVFADAGRVFIDDDELDDEFELNDEIIERIAEDFRYSVGAGLRFLVSRAIVARMDVGFSEEETGLVYLEFGHAF